MPIMDESRLIKRNVFAGPMKSAARRVAVITVMPNRAINHGLYSYGFFSGLQGKLALAMGFYFYRHNTYDHRG